MKQRSLQILKRITPAYIKNAVRYAKYLRDYHAFTKMNPAIDRRFDLSWNKRYPCLHDNTSQTSFDRHYVYHTGWAARVLAKTKPLVHVDISSSLYFASIASAFVPIKFYDYRPANLLLSNLQTEAANLLNLHFSDNSIKSLSCMHVIEHIGLGRYGDPLDPLGDQKAMAELQRVIAPGGSLLLVVPVGKSQIMFNAHRIYSPQQIISAFSKLTLEEFSLIPEDEMDGGIITNPSKSLIEKQIYGCGCFYFKKA